MGGSSALHVDDVSSSAVNSTWIEPYAASRRLTIAGEVVAIVAGQPLILGIRVTVYRKALMANLS
jgi:hypothetical protein